MTLKNTKENATIELISRRVAGEDSDKIEFTTEGGFYMRDGKFYITYREHADMGMGDSGILLKVEPDMITMRRSGDFQTVMVYKLGEITEFIYRVPFGELNLKIKTLEITNSLTDDGGKLYFCYELFAAGEQTRNEITLTVKKEGIEI